jgi:hypothetical protein
VFTHRSSRAGDPAFHDHIVLSAKVQVADGRWLALDARHLHHMIVTANALYTAELERGMWQEFGITASARTDTIRPDRRAVREFTGLPEPLVHEFSARRAATEEHLADLVRQFRQREGREPTRAEEYALAQAAALTQRHDKLATNVEGERRSWRRRAKDAGVHRPDKLLARCTAASRGRAPAQDQLAPLQMAAAQVLDVLEGERSSWSRANVLAETYRQLTATGWHLHTGDRLDHLADQVAAAVLDPRRCAPLNPGEPVDLPARYRRADGTSVFAEIGGERFTATGCWPWRPTSSRPPCGRSPSSS